MRHEEAKEIQPVEEDSVQISKRKREHEHTDTTPYECGNMMFLQLNKLIDFFYFFFTKFDVFFSQSGYSIILSVLFHVH